MHKVLHIMSGANGGGISKVVMNYYKNIDKNKISFDIAFISSSSGYIADEFRKMGSRIYELPLKSHSLTRYKEELIKILKNENYDTIHIHENDTSYVGLSIARRFGIKQRIAHSHTSAPYLSITGEIKRRLGCILNYYYATNVIACGELSGNRIFGKNNMKKNKAFILPNAIDFSNFKYNKNIRNEYRHKLNIDENYVVGMVGRLAPVKNFPFALEIISEVKKIIPKTVFLIIGDGECREYIKNLVKEKEMETYVKFLGQRDDVEMLYQCFDILILPSLHEGFPLVAVEGIVSGLKVLLSTCITREFEEYSNVKYLHLDNSAEWIQEIVEYSSEYERSNRINELEKSNLNIKHTVKYLECIYLNGTIENNNI